MSVLSSQDLFAELPQHVSPLVLKGNGYPRFAGKSGGQPVERLM